MKNDPTYIACWHTQPVIVGHTKLSTVYFIASLYSTNGTHLATGNVEGGCQLILKMVEIPTD